MLLGAPGAVAQGLCGSALGSCAPGATATLGGNVRLDGTGTMCLWECIAQDSTVHQCRAGSKATPCARAGDPAPDKREHVVTGVTRDGVPVSDDARLHSETGTKRILQTVAGEPLRICSQRVTEQADLDALAPYATRFAWGWTPPLDWATWQPRIEDACYQIVPGNDFRPIFLGSATEFRSYLNWAEQENAAGRGEITAACLYLFESDSTTQRRYVTASPTGEHTNLLGDHWVEEAAGGGCPCATEAWECGADMCPTLAAGDVIAGTSCGRPACFSNLAAHWDPLPSTICDGVSYTQTNRCNGATQNAVGTDTTPGCSGSPPPPTCGGSWGPAPSTACNGTTFTQTCSTDATLTRPAVGTDTTSPACVCPGGWGPASSTICDGLSFTQTCLSHSSLTRPATGTRTGCPPPPPTCAGSWTPAPSTVCDGDSFTQTCSTNASLTRPATGTSASACGGPCTDRTLTPTTGMWRPGTYTVCDGRSFTQARLLTCTPGTPGTGTCTTSCAGAPDEETRPAVGTMAPTWVPACGTVEQGLPFEQTDTTCGGGTQNAIGCGPPGQPCTDRVLGGWSLWSPDTSTECKGTLFSQTRTRTCTPGSPGPGTCTISCSGEMLTDLQTGTGTSCSGSGATDPDCCTPCVARTIGTYSAWSPARSEVCSGESFSRSRTRTCTDGVQGCGGCAWSCAGIQTAQTGTSTGTQTRTPRTVSGWTWSPRGADVCKGLTFTSNGTRTCTPGSGACGQSCAGVSLTSSRPGVGSSCTGSCAGSANCPQPPEPCVARTLGTYSAWSPARSSVCSGQTFSRSRSRTCTPGTKGSGGCAWSCAGVTTTQTGTSTGTMSRSPRTVSGWSAWSPRGADVCKGISFTSSSTRTCTPGSGSCGQSCAGVSLSKSRGGVGSSCTGSCAGSANCPQEPPKPPDPPPDPDPPAYTCGGLVHGSCPPGKTCATVSCRTMQAGICILHNFGCVDP